MKLSPMMQHYVDTKKEYPDCILFYRLGDFYEMFFEDAKTVARELQITLTGKKCGLEERAPMCGVPHHAAEGYIAKLVEAGYKVAICEQVEDPKEAKGIVKREVVKVVTPGTITLEGALEDKENNYLASIYVTKEGMGISYCDISTGELYVTEDDDKYNIQKEIYNQIVKISPKEIIINKSFEDEFSIQELQNISGAYIQTFPDSYFSPSSGESLIEKQWGNGSMNKFGLTSKNLSIGTLSGILTYLTETQKGTLNQITECNRYSLKGEMTLDKATLRNLEIMETLYDNKLKGSLLGILDKTNTAMGSRLLKRWLRAPLNDVDAVNKRLDGVEELSSNPLIIGELRQLLGTVYDFQRLASRIASRNANGKDLLALKSSLEALPELKSVLNCFSSDILTDLNAKMKDLPEIRTMIQNAINPEAPLTIKEGGLINLGYSEELDKLHDSIKDAKEWISTLDIREREITGIKTLKVGFNKVFGYYIEVPRSASDSVPDTYIRKQTLVNNERFITPELKEMESLVLGAESKINKLEYDLFVELREKLADHILELQRTSMQIGKLDVLVNFAHVSNEYGYVKPKVNNSRNLNIKNGRHPVIEQKDDAKVFVGNDCFMDTDSQSLMIITGPNMSGKSTYMRQTAIIVMMAQIGCFIPADEAEIGIVDRVFTRIGASDNLSQGQSTFFVEMSELAYIMNSATDRSLVILDEIGRGTSTYDGLAIAWASAEYLCNDKVQVRTLFATHYHQLTVMEEKTKGAVNLNVDVIEENGEIIFLHKIVKGSADRSYGIHVAQIAGVPDTLLGNAQRKLEILEAGSENENKVILSQEFSQKEESIAKVAEEKTTIVKVESKYNEEQEKYIEKIKNVDDGNLTMRQAMDLILDLKELLND